MLKKSPPTHIHTLAVLIFLLSSLSGNCTISDKLQENPENHSQGESSGSSTRTASGYL